MDGSTGSVAQTVRHEKMRIGGELVDTSGRIEVFNPWNNQVIGTVPRGTSAHAEKAFRIAADYKPKLSRFERSEILRRTAENITARRDLISDVITAESGLSKKDSLYECGRAYDVFSLAAQMTIRNDDETFSCDITPQGKQRRIHTMREPLRTISAITPFNHPLNMVSHKVAPSVATNNCMVVKPTELTPLTCLLLADMLYDAGLPPEMFQVVTGLPADLGDEFIVNPNIDLVTFTGSVPVGKYIAEKAGYRRTVLELGGNDPLIVMEDADLDKAAELAVAGAYKNSGQRCTAVKRVLAHNAIGDELAALIVEKSRKIKAGDPMDPETDLGTVIHEESAKTIERRVKDAVSVGAKLLLGNDRQGALYPPTVIDHVPYTAELVMEETFGPACPIIRFDSIEHAIQLSNATAFGLSSGVCTNRLDYITRFIEELNVGTVNVWEVPGYRIEMSPFGGIKDSGLGYKEGVIEAMKSYTNVKTYSLPWF
ncbi:phosphonoacetaldehyde dehydrogenase [Alphaproteobacteria bacterium HT1-32]|nr:phosphonoacetaldehyde dehydrogenase [Alphaproteobacteria bacterium HT1-32]